MKKYILLSALAAGALMMSAAQSSATPLSAASGAAWSAAATENVSSVIEVQAKRRGGNANRVAGGGRRGGGGGRGIGTGLAIGTAVGIVGGMIAAEEERRQNEAASGANFCMQRYRSCNPETGTYIGRAHPCP